MQASQKAQPANQTLWNEVAPTDFLRHSPFHEIISTKAFKRLRQISFLGAIRYVLPAHQRTASQHTRFDHSIAVARLAHLYALKIELEEKHRNRLVLAALLHDIGHSPLSHSLESVFKQSFDIDHHQATSEIIRGESTLGSCIPAVLRDLKTDPDEIIALIDGKHSSAYVHLFKSPINIDTLEGVWRSLTCAGYAHSYSPENLIKCWIADFSLDTQSNFDTFWAYKRNAYDYVINSPPGVLADAVVRSYMNANLDRFHREDFFMSEPWLFKRHPELRGVLRDAKAHSKRSHTHIMQYMKRTFSVNVARSLASVNDLYLRYTQSKSESQIEVPGSIPFSEKNMQPELFDQNFD